MTREEFEILIYRWWNVESVPFYLAQILSGEATVQETIKDLLSFEEKRGVL